TYRHSLSASSDPLMSPIFPYTTLFRSPEGYRSFDAVRAELEPRVYIEKKKQLLTERMRAAVARGGDLNAIAQSLGTTVQTAGDRSEEHTSELQSREKLVCRLLLEKKHT